jgi:hypothetical protein
MPMMIALIDVGLPLRSLSYGAGNSCLLSGVYDIDLTPQQIAIILYPDRHF